MPATPRARQKVSRKPIASATSSKRWASSSRTTRTEPRLGKYRDDGVRTAAAQASTVRTPSSRYFPSRGSVLVVLELDAHRFELVADAIGFLETFCLARGVAGIDQRSHLICIDNAAVRMIFERFAFRDRDHSKTSSRRLQFVLERELMQS